MFHMDYSQSNWHLFTIDQASRRDGFFKACSRLYGLNRSGLYIIVALSDCNLQADWLYVAPLFFVFLIFKIIKFMYFLIKLSNLLNKKIVDDLGILN